MNKNTHLNKSDTLSLAHSLCPSLINVVDPYIGYLFSNPIVFDTNEEISEYACLQMYIGQRELPNLTHALAVCRTVGGVLGIIGGVLALIIFTRREYGDCVTMIYHRFINAIEIINALIFLHDGLEKIYENYLWQFETWAYTSVFIIMRYRGSILFIVSELCIFISFFVIIVALENAKV